MIERENIYTIPNALCMGRIIMSPYISNEIIQGKISTAMTLVLIAGLTDFADGWIARNWKGQKSSIGSFLDPLADKLLMAALVFSLGYSNLMPLWLVVMILSRDVFLVIFGFVIRYRSLPHTCRILSRYFDPTFATVQLAPTFISKVNTVVQMFTVIASLGATIWNFVEHPALLGIQYLTCFMALASLISYIVQKDTYIKCFHPEIKN